MVGQIRSYISYISVDSDQSYLDRIKSMIESVPDENERAILITEYINKINQINIMKKYNENKVVTETQEVKVPDIEPIDEPEEKIKTFEEEMEEKIREYQSYNEDKKEEPEEESKLLPSIYSNAYNLVKISSIHPVLLKNMPSRKKSKVMVKTNLNGNVRKIPALPIIDDAA